MPARGRDSRWQALALLSGHFLDVVRGLATLRAFRREAAQAETIERVSERYRVETMGTLRVAFLSALVLELCAMIGTALVAVTIGLQLDGGHLSLQAGLTVLLLAPELYGPLRAVGQQFHASTDGMAAAERIFAVLDAPPALAAACRRRTPRRLATVADPRERRVPTGRPAGIGCPRAVAAECPTRRLSRCASRRCRSPTPIAPHRC